MKKKTVALLLACVMALGVAVGGTLAWLTATDEPVVNTFTPSDINITLTETTTDYKMVPGHTIDKDPVVTVEAGSEDCWVFIKVEDQGVSFTPEGETMPQVYAFSDFISYGINPNNWEQLKDGDSVVPGVYVTKGPVTAVTNNRSIKVLGYYNGEEIPKNFVDNKVLVKDTVTKEMMDIVEKNGNPTLTFTAYASQYWKNNTEHFTAKEAWDIISGT